MIQKIYNIPLSNAFVDVLAEKFLAEYAEDLPSLTEVVFLLPNRRACQALKEAFVRCQGLVPTLLPQMLPIGDVEEETLFLAGFDGGETLKELLLAVDKTTRMLWFTKKIMTQPMRFGIKNFSAEQAYFLAEELCSLIDAVHNENLSFLNLQNLVPEEYAAHWLETLNFLEIIMKEWPEYLQSKGMCDPSFRQNEALRLQNKIWLQNPPQKKIVIAGITATYPAMKEMVKTVLKLPQGEVILAGLDKLLDEESWNEIDESHPQYELKDLLQYLQIKRVEVKDFVAMGSEPREKLISEIMRPAKTTDKWRNITQRGLYHEAWDGLQLINCRDVREEAISIALIMRENLETPEKTAALVTTDRNLARRVAAELERWEIKVDDSAGQPLGLTPVGIFLRLLIKVVEKDFAPIELLSLLKHPLMAMGKDYGAMRRIVRDYEKQILRTDEPVENEMLQNFIAEIKESLRELYELIAQPVVDFKYLLETHIKIAENLATTISKEGTAVLWSGDAGEAAARFVADLYANASSLEIIKGAEYLGLIEALMTTITVRPKYGTHPRLKILGPIEARLTHFDTIIIGEVNETSWPKAVEADPWMSRPMKRNFGLPLPEKNIGILAHDFSQLMAAETVYLTRAERVQATPMVKSRWWMRLETVLKALQIDVADIMNTIFPAWASLLDKAKAFKPILPPAPKPPVAVRPRELSASAIENLMRDPYIIFAKYILRLKPLKDLNQELNFADYGNIVHAILEEFNNKYNTEFPENPKGELLKLGEEYFKAHKVAMETRAFWWPNFEKTVDWLADKEKKYRSEIKKIHNEIRGEISLNAPAGIFKLTAKADRVDETKDGRINIIDYKTGQARTKNEMIKGYAPQLPIEGLIAEQGGFPEITKKEIKALIYWQLGRKETIIEENIEDILSNTLKRIHELIAIFDLETTAYTSQPNPKYAPKYSDYEHLSRVGEWGIIGDTNE